MAIQRLKIRAVALCLVVVGFLLSACGDNNRAKVNAPSSAAASSSVVNNTSSSLAVSSSSSLGPVVSALEQAELVPGYLPYPPEDLSPP